MACLFWNHSVAFLECGIGNEVVTVLTQFVGGSSQEIKVTSLCKTFQVISTVEMLRCIHSNDMHERCTMLMESDQQMEIRKKTLKEEISRDNVYLDQSLSTALDSFDNLFCHRCLVSGLALCI